MKLVDVLAPGTPPVSVPQPAQLHVSLPPEQQFPAPPALLHPAPPVLWGTQQPLSLLPMLLGEASPAHFMPSAESSSFLSAYFLTSVCSKYH